MNFRPLLLVSAIVFVLILALAPTGQARPTAQAFPAAQAEPGNYCAGCHTAVDNRPAQVMAWTGGVDRLEVRPCPAAGQAQEQGYYTERMLLAVDRARQELPGWADVGQTDTRVAASRETYSRLLDSPVDSLNAFTSDSQVLRFRLGKSYRLLNQVENAVKQQHVLFAAIGVTLFLIVSLGWAWRHTTRYAGPGLGPFRPGLKAVLFIILVFILFSLPIFRVFSQEVAETSDEEQARQTALDEASRAAEAADRALARSWALAHVGAEWAGVNAEAGESALETALAAADEARINATALWGESQAAHEGAMGSAAAMDEAVLIARELEARRSRAWPLRLMAADWAAIDPALAEALLEEALITAEDALGVYRDLDLRAIAVTWAAIDPDKGLAVAGRINEPAIQAWGLWEMADVTGDTALYEQAARAARQVAGPAERARLLGQIAARSGQESLFGEALDSLAGAEGPALAYTLSDLAAASGDAGLAARIDPAYAGARTAALYGLGQFEEAWAAAAEIADPFDRAHAQAAIAAAWENSEAAGQIADPTLRVSALRDIAVAKGDAALAKEIASPYHRVQALAALGQYQAALAEAENLSDPYPLRAVGMALAESEPETALAVVDMLDREVDKADVLRAVAAATGDDELFERALGMALAARVRGDALAPVEASLALARSFSPIDQAKAEIAFNQAYETAHSISTK